MWSGFIHCVVECFWDYPEEYEDDISSDWYLIADASNKILLHLSRSIRQHLQSKKYEKMQNSLTSDKILNYFSVPA